MKGKTETALSKLLNALVGVIHCQPNTTFALEFVHFSSLFLSTLASENDFESARFIDSKVSGLVLISKGVSAYNDGLLPTRNQSRHILDDYGLSEDSAIEDIADGSIRALPHLLQLELLYTCLIRSNCGTLDAHFMFLDCQGCINSYLVLSGITILNA